MQIKSKIIKYLSVVMILGSMLSGCQTQNYNQNEKYYQQSSSYKQANQILSHIEPDYNINEKNDLILNAVEKYIDANLTTKAHDLLSKVDYDTLNEKQSVKYHFLQAKIYLNSDDSLKALNELDEIRELSDSAKQLGQNDLQNENANTIGITAIDKLNTNKNYTINDELNLRVEIDHQIKNQPVLESQNNKNIWHKLITQNEHSIDKLLENNLKLQQEQLVNQIDSEVDSKTNTTNNILIGWLELAKINKSSKIINNDALYLNNIKNWQNKFKSHPANSYLAQTPSINNIKPNENYTIPPKKIAVMLPLSGKLSEIASAIKDGIITAHYQDKNQNKPEIIFIDTFNQDIEQQYNKVIENKVDIIIGPLDKSDVAKLNTIHNKNIPIIALNYISEDIQQSYNQNIFQFGLSAEDESKQAALKTWQSGLKNTLILADDTDWGYRVSQSFQKQFESLDGRVAKIAFIGPDTNYKQLVYSSLGIEDSQKRKNVLQWIVGNKLSFQPRRKQDFDNIFLVTSAMVAKQIKPILKFYYADNMQITATSNIIDFNTHNNIGNKYSSDLADIHFCDIPLVIQESKENTKIIKLLQKTWPQDYHKFIRLYALGIDAYNLSYNLNKLITYKSLGVAANTGHLLITDNGQITRNLPWAKIDKSGIKIIDVL